MSHQVFLQHFITFQSCVATDLTALKPVPTMISKIAKSILETTNVFKYNISVSSLCCFHLNMCLRHRTTSCKIECLGLHVLHLSNYRNTSKIIFPCSLLLTHQQWTALTAPRECFSILWMNASCCSYGIFSPEVIGDSEALWGFHNPLQVNSPSQLVPFLEKSDVYGQRGM